jgi:hypothetical protein
MFLTTPKASYGPFGTLQGISDVGYKYVLTMTYAFTKYTEIVERGRKTLADAVFTR